ncbi:hypothetical protein HK101_004666 [Irineochytrium annulatum]|nr:hypothetical protein HK101_004666 [Irineochytrium annulatum]
MVDTQAMKEGESWRVQTADMVPDTCETTATEGVEETASEFHTSAGFKVLGPFPIVTFTSRCIEIQQTNAYTWFFNADVACTSDRLTISSTAQPIEGADFPAMCRDPVVPTPRGGKNNSAKTTSSSMAAATSHPGLASCAVPLGSSTMTVSAEVDIGGLTSSRGVGIEIWSPNCTRVAVGEDSIWIENDGLTCVDDSLEINLSFRVPESNVGDACGIDPSVAFNGPSNVTVAVEMPFCSVHLLSTPFTAIVWFEKGFKKYDVTLVSWTPYCLVIEYRGDLLWFPNLGLACTNYFHIDYNARIPYLAGSIPSVCDGRA